MSKTDGIGTWYFKAPPTFSAFYVTSYSGTAPTHPFNFTCAGKAYIGMHVNSTLPSGMVGDNVTVANPEGGYAWGDAKYRTIVIATAVTNSTALAFLQTNADYRSATEFLDETGTRQFAGKVKGYVDGRTAFRVTNVVVGTDVIDVTIE